MSNNELGQVGKSDIVWHLKIHLVSLDSIG